MYLAAAEEPVEPGTEGPERSPVHARWEAFPVSELAHHNQACCEMAREWLRSMDYSQLNGGGLLTGPRWLRERYDWGPSAWPLHWCEAVGVETVDCGVHAAFADEVFEARGVTSFRAQFVQQYNSQAVEQWQTIWARENVPSPWLGKNCIYHEGNAVLIGSDEVKLWDGSASCWLNPLQSGGYGGLLSLRIFVPPALAGGGSLQWGGTSVSVNEWNHIGREPAPSMGPS